MKTNFIFIMLLFWTYSFSQQKLKKADRLFDEMAYVEAAEAYEDFFAREKKPPVQALLNAAESHYKIGDYQGAIIYYKKVLSVQSNAVTEKHLFNFFRSLRALKQYEQADELEWRQLERIGNEIEKKRFKTQKNYLDSITKLPPAFTVRNVASVNTAKADFGTAFYGTQVVFSSSKDTMKIGGKTYKYNMQPYLELYIADRNEEDGMLINQKKFIAKEQIDYHNAVVAFSPDMHTMYYSANIVKPSGRLNNSKGGTNNLGIFYGLAEEDNLREVKPLPFNNIEYSVAHPALTEDGRWLYFVSNMPGGYGETDVYKVEVMPDGNFGQPQNLGAVINTPHKEMFPFVQDDVLYFASEGHYGLGGLDVFRSKIIADTYAGPQNMGLPINSNHDDFALVFAADGTYGYLSSNREGGKDDDDIYYFTRKEECKQSVSGLVLHKKSKAPLKGAKITAVGAGGKVIAAAEADNNGYYTFMLPCDATVFIEASEDDYTAEKAEVVTAREPEQRKVDFELTKYDDLIVKEGEVEKVAINPIYFDLDKYDITKQAVIELDKVVYVMKNFQDIIIKIESHTDSRASDEYNTTLSQNRAKATYDYIISKGIDPKRIESVTGYGETRLLNGCSNDVPCSEEEHQLNRRSEFIIVKK